ncbi:hypothetical protein DXG01_013519 [Tephrocybe rancida]|nr:hypothetical protein DXG01_013519 [Tephrocybe rancida]
MAITNAKQLLHQASSMMLPTMLREHNPLAYDPQEEHHWLYKDTPRGWEDAYDICITGGRQMTVTVGRKSQSDNNPVETLWTVGGRVDFSKPFSLTAQFDSSGGAWPSDLSFRRLGEFLSVLAHGEIPYEHWSELNIILPDVKLSYDTNSPALIRLGAFKILHLKWAGHRQQLIASWLPFAPSLLQNLATLHLTCHLALQDCTYILFHANNLKEFMVHSIYKGFAHEPILPFESSGVRVKRPHLECLTLTSDDDIAPLMQLFSFTSLYHINFHLCYPTMSTFHYLDIWRSLKTAYLDCWITDEDADWVRSQCPPTVKLDFEWARSWETESTPIDASIGERVIF